MTNILIIDDNETDRSIIAVKIRKSFGHETEEVSTGQEGLNLLKNKSRNPMVDLVLLDQNMPGISGLKTLESIKKIAPHLPVIMITGTQDTNLAIEAMRKGATDFITKPFQDERLFASIHNALKINALRSELKQLKSHQKFEDLIGYNQGLSESIEVARKAANYDIPVMVTGETGTGKEVLSNAIHGESSRRDRPFIAVNCGAIPENLVESTLFGHKKGAFTGAVSDSPGRFAEAEGGTIFLDEIGDLPLDAQVKILRVIQQKVVRPVGGDAAIPVNVRIISATNKNLAELVEKGSFREDLFFRLNVLSIEIPPLRSRKKDIPLFIDHFIQKFCAREDVASIPLDKAAHKLLLNYWWPGNVREMENAINRAMVLAKGSSLGVSCFDLISDRRSERRNAARAPSPRQDFDDPREQTPQRAETQPLNKPLSLTPTAQPLSLFLKDNHGTIKTMEALEREIVHQVMGQYAGNISKAAKALGISRATFYRKLRG